MFVYCVIDMTAVTAYCVQCLYFQLSDFGVSEGSLLKFIEQDSYDIEKRLKNSEMTTFYRIVLSCFFSDSDEVCV